jgi:hypothetical protein
MDRSTRRILSLILVISLLAISTSVVFAKELGLLTISGPGIKGEMTIKDPDATMGLEKSGFFDQTASIKPPENLGEGYTLTAHLNLDGRMVPYIEMVYYPLAEGERGYVHYTGRMNGEKLQSVDRWQLLSLSGEQAIRSLLTENNIAIQSALIEAPAAAAPAEDVVSEPAAEPATAPVRSPAPVQTPAILIALAAGILVLTGVTLALRRRTFSNPT